jgi:beta-galactosidase
MNLKLIMAVVGAVLTLNVQTLFAAPTDNMSDKMLFDSGWRFHLGDVAEASKPDYNDRSWRELNLPHDWSIEQNPSKEAPAGNDGGYYPTGTGWYRKIFVCPSKMSGRKMWLYFEGVYMNSTVYLNGKNIGGHPYGFSSFFCDATDAMKPGKNVLAVRVDNSAQKNCRWYSGSGIYRHVWLLNSPMVHIDNWGIQAHAVKVTPAQADVEVKTMVSNETSADKKVMVKTRIGQAEQISSEVLVSAGSSVEVSQMVSVANPKLWDLDSPSLYDAEVTLTSDNKVIDRQKQSFGIRTLKFSTDGFFLNGRPVRINGGCMHSDNGILGAVSFDRSEERRVRLMKNAGFNAIRTSHNPPSPAFLDACDRLGMLVIDEAFDGWREAKNTYDYHLLIDEWWKKDIDAMVKRDINHPSVMAWSIGNEVIERKKIEVVTTARKLASEIRKYDDRPVTSALAAWDRDWEIYDPLAAEHDVVGYNYLIQLHASDHARVPERVMWQTESYPRDNFRNWATVHDNSYVLGDFVWTGMDYLGESGIGRYWYDGETPGEHYQNLMWPCTASYCGDIDLTGWRKPVSHYRDMLWNDNREKLYMAVREPNGYKGKINAGQWAVWPTWESWNWPGWESKPIDVEVYSRYPVVRLYLNDAMVGEKQVGLDTELKAVFSLPYAAGTLRVEGLDNGKVMETRSLSTAGRPVAIRLQAENETMKVGGDDVSFVHVEVVDKDGNICPNADDSLLASVSGSCTLSAFGNADFANTVTYTSPVRKVWKGRALIVVRSKNKRGNATLLVSGKGLQSAKINFRVK